MSPTETMFIVLAFILLVVVSAVVILPMFKRKGIDAEAVLKQTRDALVTVSNAFDTVKPFLPESAAVNKFEDIVGIVQIGVDNAEQLYHISELEGDKRKVAAKQYIDDALDFVGIEKTKAVERLVDGALEASVFRLGHKEPDAG